MWHSTTTGGEPIFGHDIFPSPVLWQLTHLRELRLRGQNCTDIPHVLLRLGQLHTLHMWAADATLQMGLHQQLLLWTHPEDS